MLTADRKLSGKAGWSVRSDNNFDYNEDMMLYLRCNMSKLNNKNYTAETLHHRAVYISLVNYLANNCESGRI